MFPISWWGNIHFIVGELQTQAYILHHIKNDVDLPRPNHLNKKTNPLLLYQTMRGYATLPFALQTNEVRIDYARSLLIVIYILITLYFGIIVGMLEDHIRSHN